MYRAARTDGNQTKIVADLRKAGISVELLHGVGSGVPDIICGYNGMNYFFEIKNSNKPPSKRKLTPHQVEWHSKWQGQVDVITSAQDALEIMCSL